MWLKAKHIKEAINIAANKIVEEVDIKSVVEEIKTDIAKNVLAKIEKQMWDNYGSFTNGQINHSLKSEMSRAKEKAANRIVYEIVEKKKKDIIDSFDDKEFHELLKEGIKNSIKERTGL